MSVNKFNPRTNFAEQCLLDPTLKVAALPGLKPVSGVGYTTISFCGGPNEPWHKVSYRKKGRKARKSEEVDV